MSVNDMSSRVLCYACKRQPLILTMTKAVSYLYWSDVNYFRADGAPPEEAEGGGEAGPEAGLQ